MYLCYHIEIHSNFCDLYLAGDGYINTRNYQDIWLCHNVFVTLSLTPPAPKICGKLTSQKQHCSIIFSTSQLESTCPLQMSYGIDFE